MKRSSALLATCLFALAPVGGYGETVYISDELTVPLRTGASNEHRILHRGLPSGLQMEVLQIDEAAGFSEVRTANGTQGWMRSQYLVAEPIAKTRLAAAQREVASLRGQRLFQAQRVDELASTAREQADLNSASDSRIAELESELSEIRRISVNAINAHEENLASLETIARLRDEIDDLADDRNRLQDNSENQGILIGAGLLLLGLLVGVIIKARPLRSAWS